MNYSVIAKSYNELYGQEQIKKLELIKNILRIKKSYKLLDVGCGTGISTNYFVNSCHVTGVDPCKELLSQSKGNFILAKAESLPFKDHSFDIVISVTAIHNFDNPELGIKEMKRVLKKKGQIVVSILKRSKKLKLIEEFLKKEFKNLNKIEEEKDVIYSN